MIGSAAGSPLGIAPRTAALTPAQLLTMQRTAGNQAVQRMLAQPTAASNKDKPIQRLKAEDIYVLEKADPPPEEQLRQMLNLFTNWENAAGDVLTRAKRQKMSRDRVDGFLTGNFAQYLNNRESLYAYVKANVYDALVEEEARQEEQDPKALFEQLVFTSRFSLDHQVLQDTLGYMPNFDMNQQLGIFERIYEMIDLRALQYLRHFERIVHDFDCLSDLYAVVLRSSSFRALDDEAADRHLEELLGEGPEKEQRLELLALKFPELSLIVPPQAYFKDDSLDRAKVGEAIQNEEIRQLLAIMSKSGNAGEIANAMKQLGRFLNTTSATPEDIKLVKKALTTIVELRNPTLRNELYDSLGHLLPKRETEVTDDSYSDEDSYDQDGILSEQDKKELTGDIEESTVPTRPIRILLSDVYPGYLTDVNITDFLGNGETRKLLKNAPINNRLLSAVAVLKNTNQLTKESKAEVLQKIFQDSKALAKNQVIELFGTMKLLLDLGKGMSLHACDDMTKMKSILDDEMGAVLGLEEDEMTESGMARLLNKFRSVQDLLVYAATLDQIEDPDQRVQAKNGFRAFVLTLMEDEDNTIYRQFRYGELGQEDDDEVQQALWGHLAQVLQLPEILEEWSLGDSMTVESDGTTWHVQDTDAPSDMLLLGTDITTCQNVYNGSQNQCLLSYLIDGKNRALVIKKVDPKKKQRDVDNRIVGRALFKLLVNDQGENVLYIEKVYTDNTQIDIDQAKALLLQMAKKRAAEMAKHLADLHLLSTNQNAFTQTARYDQSIHSLGGPAPFDYNDTVLENGPPNFTIDQSHIVKLPY